MPVAAVMPSGKPMVSSGSQIAAFGMNSGLAKVSLRPSFMIMTNPTETSLPVPAVVGTAINGATVLTSCPPPVSGSYCVSGPPLPASKATALPRSIAEPPPIASTPLHPSAVYCSKALVTAASVGLPGVSSKIEIGTSAASAPVTLSTSPAARTPASVAMNSLEMPALFSSEGSF